MLLLNKTSQSDRNGNVQYNVPLYSEEVDRQINPPPTYGEVVTRDILLTPALKSRLIILCFMTIIIHCSYIFTLTEDGGKTKTTSNPFWIGLYILVSLISSITIRKQAFVWVFGKELSPQSSLSSSTAGREVLLTLWIVNTVALLAGLKILSDFSDVHFSEKAAMWIIVAFCLYCGIILSVIIAVFRAAHAQQEQIRI